MIVIQNEGAPLLLKCTLRVPLDEEPSWQLYLYTNDYTPLPTSTAPDFTLDEALGGPFPVNGADWGPISIVLDHPVSTYNPPTSFTFTNPGPGSVTVYGFVVIETINYWATYAERFDTPRVVSAGQSFDLILTFTGGNCPLT